MLRVCTALFILFFACQSTLARAPFMRFNPNDYIELYKADALKQMFEQGVPASITLGQAMVESDFGNSDLAVFANNHFGLKCHKEWIGDTYNYDDDEMDECFRKYEHVLDSYFDHSMFIKTRSRYDFLFNLSLTDYRAWANGLKGAGYATHPEYAEKVIAVIERYRLYELDQNGYISTPDLGLNNSTVKNAKEIHAAKKTKANIINKHEPIKYNKSSFIIVKEGDTYAKIAKEFKLNVGALLAYNDYTGKPELYDGGVVFIAPKRVKARVKKHIVEEGETMKSIAQLYAIDLRSLYAKNGMKLRDKDPKPGTVLYLRRNKPKH